MTASDLVSRLVLAITDYGDKEIAIVSIDKDDDNKVVNNFNVHRIRRIPPGDICIFIKEQF